MELSRNVFPFHLLNNNLDMLTLPVISGIFHFFSQLFVNLHTRSHFELTVPLTVLLCCCVWHVTKHISGHIISVKPLSSSKQKSRLMQSQHSQTDST